MRFNGVLKTWNDERGFGFIEPLQGGQEIFVHMKSFPPGAGRPRVGLSVSFEVELGSNGKKRATSVQFLRTEGRTRALRREVAAPWTLSRVLVVPAFVVIYLAVARMWPVSHWVAGAYFFVSLIAFVAYAVDKSAARHGRWRTPEKSLHWCSLACGWPGALLAQQLLRHKLGKKSFVRMYWVTVAVNVSGFIAIHSPAFGRLLS